MNLGLVKSLVYKNDGHPADTENSFLERPRAHSVSPHPLLHLLPRDPALTQVAISKPKSYNELEIKELDSFL